MRKGRPLSMIVLLVVLAVGLSGQLTAAPRTSQSADHGDSFLSASAQPVFLPTPDDAIREYLAGVADADVDRILRATAVDEMSEGVRYDLLIERLNAYTPHMGLAPSEYPFFAGITRTKQASNILSQVQMLAYSLLSDDPIEETISGSDLEPDAKRWAQGFVDEVDPSRLADLAIEAILPADAERMDSDFYRSLAARQSAIVGADEQTERVVLVSFEGETYVVGFTLLRYGDGWTEPVKSGETPRSRNY